MSSLLRVAIVGGSLGGLTAALVLRDAGCQVTVFERSTSALESRGAGIVLHPVTERYLTEKGRASPAEIGTTASWVRYLGADGRVLHTSPCSYRFTAWNILYGRLLRELEPERYRYGRLLTGLDLDQDRAQARFSDGACEDIDLLVGADGISSTARSLLLPEVRPAYSGYVGWRGTVPEAQLSATAMAAVGDSIVYHLMPDSHVLTYPIPGFDGSVAAGHRLINFVWYRNVSPGRALADMMTGRDGVRRDTSLPPGGVQDRYVEEMQAAAARLPPAVREVVRRTEEPFIQPVMDVAVPTMAFGRACLVGDAAFAARPHAAAGTAKAAADAWALGEALAAAGWDVARALPAWERRQRALGAALVDRARRLGNASQFGGGWQPGDPGLRFGLERPGDSEITNR